MNQRPTLWPTSTSPGTRGLPRGRSLPSSEAGLCGPPARVMKKETEGQVSKEADLQAKSIYNRVNPQQQVGNSRPPGTEGGGSFSRRLPCLPSQTERPR